MSNTIFKKVTVESFGGISPDSPLTIVFPENYGGGTIIEGDQETGKTSTMVCLEALLGGLYSDYYVNKNSKTINGWMEFEVDGVQYRSKVTKTMFKLEQYVNVAGKDKWMDTGESKTLIRRLLPYATSPEILTTYDGEKQLEWIKKISGKSTDDISLSVEYKSKYDERTAKNREVKFHKEQLLKSSYYVSEGADIKPTEEFEIQQKILLEVDIDKIISLNTEVLSGLEKEYDVFNRAKTKLEGIDEKIADKQKQIDEKKLQIEAILKSIQVNENEIKELGEQKEKGKLFIEENGSIIEKIADAKKELETNKGQKTMQSQVEATIESYNTYKKVFDESLLLTNKLDEIHGKRLSMAKSLTPEIPGFEVELGNIDKDKGLYMNGVNISTLSESERLKLCIQIWKYYGTKVIFIENINGIGSVTMNAINLFLQEGGTVFATQMRRGQDKISISFSLNE